MGHFFSIGKHSIFTWTGKYVIFIFQWDAVTLSRIWNISPCSKFGTKWFFHQLDVYSPIHSTVIFNQLSLRFFFCIYTDCYQRLFLLGNVGPFNFSKKYLLFVMKFYLICIAGYDLIRIICSANFLTL